MKKLVVIGSIACFALTLYAADGPTVFKTKGCVGCHGADGSKAMPAMGVKPLSSADVQGKTDAQLTASIAKGQGKMPAYAGKLSDDEIKASVAFVRSLKK